MMMLMMVMMITSHVQHIQSYGISPKRHRVTSRCRSVSLHIFFFNTIIINRVVVADAIVLLLLYLNMISALAECVCVCVCVQKVATIKTESQRRRE